MMPFFFSVPIFGVLEPKNGLIALFLGPILKFFHLFIFLHFRPHLGPIWVETLCLTRGLAPNRQIWQKCQNHKNTPFFIFDFLGLKSPAGMPNQYYIEISWCFSVSVSYANFGVFASKSNFEQFLCPKSTFEGTFREQTLKVGSLKVPSKVDFSQKN